MSYSHMSRDIGSEVSGVRTTFSSWDNCMSKAYCKWPAIVGIVVASLIVLSVVWCLARCLCCGASCCCSCLRCLDCFTPSRHSRNRDSKEDYRPMMNSQGFQPMPSPMIYNQAPQFATFDSPSGKIHEDSLPAMPSWETAQKRRVENPDAAQPHGEDVEMGRLGQTQNQQQRTGRSGYNQVPNGPASPVHLPYGPYGQSTEYFGAGALPAGAASNPYNSDLGPQRLTPQQPQAPFRQQSYASNFQTAPTSPAPTYATHAPEFSNLGAVAASDRFDPDVVSPSPEQYNRNYTHSPPQHDQFAQPQQNNFSKPYAPTVSTRYEPSEYQYQDQPQYVSPTLRNAPQAMDYGQESSYVNTNLSPTSHQRPPSLLQVGRKPVPGALREI